MIYKVLHRKLKHFTMGNKNVSLLNLRSQQATTVSSCKWNYVVWIREAYQKIRCVPSYNKVVVTVLAMLFYMTKLSQFSKYQQINNLRHYYTTSKTNKFQRSSIARWTEAIPFPPMIVHVLIFPSYILDHDWFLQSQNC